MSKRFPITENVRHFNLNFIPRAPGIYVVGGTVRDLLLGRCPRDYDIAAFRPPEAVAEQIARAAGGRPVRIGKGEKTIYRVVTPSRTYDVSAGRGGGIAADLAERDFTVNAMAFSPAENRLIDPLNGRQDLCNGVVRMIAPGSFLNDPLRLLRAFRMAADLDFSIETQTLGAISTMADAIGKTAGERIRDEWLKLIAAPGCTPLIEQMDNAGLLGAIFPELFPLKGCVQKGHHRFDVFTHTMSVFRHLEQLIEENVPALSAEQKNKDLLCQPAAAALLKHAALFHDIGKPPVRSIDNRGRIHFYGHGKTGADMAAAISDRLRLSNWERGYIDTLIRHHLHPLSLYILQTRKEFTRRARTRFFMKAAAFTPDLIVLSTADMLGKGYDRNMSDYTAFARRLLESYLLDYRPASKRPPLITGRDLIEQFGMTPSPRFAHILRRIETGRLAGRIRTRAEAVAAVRKILGSENRS